MEIGTFDGIVLIDLARKFPGVQFDTIDPFVKAGGTDAGHEEIFYHNLNKFKVNNVRLFKQKSIESNNEIKAEYDFIFIDGDHSYETILSDLNIYFSKLKKGEYCLVHDYGLIKDVRKAIKRFLDTKTVEITISDRIDSSILLCKKKNILPHDFKFAFLFLKQITLRISYKLFNKFMCNVQKVGQKVI